MESADEQQDIKKEQAEEEAGSGIEDVSDDDDEEEGDGDDDDDDDEEEEDEDGDEEWDSDEEVGEENEADDNGDDDDEGEEEEDCDDEDDDEGEAVLEASDSEGEDGERCPICLNRFKDQDVGTPEACDHVFCLECIQEWSANVNTCPVDRQVFKLILCKHGVDDIIYKKLTVEDVNKQADDEEEEEPTYCEVCHQCNREDRLLLCDGCDLGYHLDCLSPPLSQVPVEEWFCPNCARREGADADYLPASGFRRQIPRTLVMERVRSAIEERRVRRTLRRIVSSDEEEEEEEEEIGPLSSAGSSSVSSPAKKSPVKKPTAKRKTPRKYTRRKKRKTTKRKTPKKTATGKKKSTIKKKRTKTTRKRKTKRRGKKGKKLKRLARTAKPAAVTTVKTRIAGALGLTNPPKGRTIPMQKLKQEKSIDMKRADIGAASLSIFGHRDQINFYEDEQDEPGTSSTTVGGSAGTRKYSKLSLSSYKPIGRVPAV
ncbi:PHD and RING finger domain-containing protein 1-like [Mercenaria mercenaria]|uniref:PHD and RING finger domain-containing protein 1-like n=1 Tax=Mercenaria mercenaria TaxID=6596 RepID=UPI00234F1B93|nr:PHD and RING finger domain-containing protein 1-like [Mercenaria mercenaria]XP_053384019.1 PHD and RING finger domain-containing protein 1-like [Mercenaria mercenaria]